MDSEPEVTRADMDETRAALSEKLETLEHQVVDTVQGASNAVADTVESVKDAVHDTVVNVKDALNLHLQVKRHPWGVLAGSIALGYLLGYLLFRGRSDRPALSGRSEPAARDSSPMTKRRNGAEKVHHAPAEAWGRNPSQEASQAFSGPR